MKKVILINATGLGYQVIRALRKKNIECIVIYDQENEELGRFSRYAYQSVMVPNYIEEPDRLLEYLLKKGNEWSGMLLVPTKDYGVVFLAKHKKELAKHYIVPTPGLDVVTRILDKKLLYDHLRKQGIGAPDTYTAQSLQELYALKDKISFPCLLKPGLAHLFLRKFSFKMLEIHSFEELARNYNDLTEGFTTDPYDLMICDIVPGPDLKQMIQYVSYMDREGEVLASMTSRKIRQDPPKYGQGRVARSEKIPGLDEISEKLLKDLGYFGFSEIEWKLDPRDGTYKVIDINPRFIFYLALCVECGINFPYIQYADLVLNQKIRVDKFKENVYWINEYKDFLHTILNHKLETFTIWDYIRPYLGRKSFAIFDYKDPRPFYEQIKEHADNVLKRRFS
jgi:D-aspartate ligase